MVFAVILDPDFRPQRVQTQGTAALLSNCLFLVFLLLATLTDVDSGISPFFTFQQDFFVMGSTRLGGSTV